MQQIKTIVYVHSVSSVGSHARGRLNLISPGPDMGGIQTLDDNVDRREGLGGSGD